MLYRHYRYSPISGLRLLAAFHLLACVAIIAGCRQKPDSSDESPVLSVTVALPVEKEIVDLEDFTGHTDAVESVDIRSRVTGYLDKVCFYDGVEVKKGTLLFEIDRRPFQAEYDQAEAQVKLYEADMAFRESELARAKQLIVKNAISQSDFDQIVASHGKATSAIASAKANAEKAQLNLEFTELRSPIDGEISRTLITKGNLVSADLTLLTTVVSVDPMYAYFDVDEPTILRIQKEIREGRIKVRNADQIPVWMGLDNEEGYPREGLIDFSENRIDSSTGTIQMRGKFANPKPAVGERALKPGLHVRVRVPVSQLYNALMVPKSALMKDQGQQCLLVVDDKNKVESRPVKLGRLEGQLQVIREGLKPGERVIVRGLQRVRPGMTVAPTMADKK